MILWREHNNAKLVRLALITRNTPQHSRQIFKVSTPPNHALDYSSIITARGCAGVHQQIRAIDKLNTIFGQTAIDRHNYHENRSFIFTLYYTYYYVLTYPHAVTRPVSQLLLRASQLHRHTVYLLPTRNSIQKVYQCLTNAQAEQNGSVGRATNPSVRPSVRPLPRFLLPLLHLSLLTCG